MAGNSRPRWLQFSLRSVVWTMLCVGIGIGTYQQGFYAGRNYKEPPSEPSFGHAQVYYVEDLVASGRYESTSSGLDDIRQQITGRVLPASWRENGGKASIRGWESNGSIVVMHDQSGHELVADYLNSLRESVAKSETNSH